MVCPPPRSIAHLASGDRTHPEVPHAIPLSHFGVLALFMLATRKMSWAALTAGMERKVI